MFSDLKTAILQSVLFLHDLVVICLVIDGELASEIDRCALFVPYIDPLPFSAFSPREIRLKYDEHVLLYKTLRQINFS